MLLQILRISLKYADTHEWVKVEDDAATVGITEHAQIISDFDAKLMVMLLGQYSTGKTTFPGLMLHLIKQI